MIFQYSQDTFKIPERVQIVSLCSFRDAVNDSTGICTIRTVDQLPRIFMETKAAQGTFCRIVIQGISLSSRNDFKEAS